jgi:hypothetical protein
MGNLKSEVVGISGEQEKQGWRKNSGAGRMGGVGRVGSVGFQ